MILQVVAADFQDDVKGITKTKARHSRESGNPEILEKIEKTGFPLSRE